MIRGLEASSALSWHRDACKRRWVMSFERTNLELAVRQRTAGDIAAQLSELIAARRAGGPPEPTIIYTITRGDAEKVAQVLEVRDSAAAPCVTACF